MEFVKKLEKLVEDWLSKLKLPHLPNIVRQWIGDNIWWIVAILAVLSAIGALVSLTGLFTTLAALATPAGSWYVGAVLGWVVVSTVVSLVFSVLDAVLLGLAVNPLRAKQLKGWTLLFWTWLLGALSVAINVVVSILSINIIGAIFGIIFGALFLGVSAYILFQIRSVYAHVSKSAGVKKPRSKK